MIITQTPLRVSFFGGGTDYRPFFEKYGGSVLSTTIDKFCYVTVRNLPSFFEYSNEIVYSKVERTISPDEIEHPSVREAMKLFGMRDLRIVYDADLPARTGLGSSSSFSVGLINALYALQGKMVDKCQLAKDAIMVERELCHESGGEQDQVAAAYGGFNRINFTAKGFDVCPVPVSTERLTALSQHLLLFFTGMTRYSSTVAKEQLAMTESKIDELKEMLALVDEGEKILTSKRELKDFGSLLDHTWRLKRRLTRRISSDSINEIYRKAKSVGAIGGKLLGAGGGGFFLLFVEPDLHTLVKKALEGFMCVQFGFEREGVKTIYYS